MPGIFDPATGKPINPETMEVIPDKFDYQTGRPINPVTGEVFPLNPKGEPVDESRGGMRLPTPCKFDPKTEKPIDPKTGKPLNLNKPIDPEVAQKKIDNDTNNYHGRKFNQDVKPVKDNNPTLRPQ